MSSIETMKTWSVLMKSYEDVPLVFKEPLKEFLVLEDTFPYTILTPLQNAAKRATTLKLLCLFNEKIILLETLDMIEVVSTVYYFKDIDYVESGTILLHSWIKVEGISKDVVKNSIIYYNSVTDYLFAPVVEKIRESIMEYGESDLHKERNKFLYLENAYGFKYSNIGRNSIREGEKLIDIVFQQPIYKVVLNLMIKKFYKTITNAHMSILTDKELILMKDPELVNYGYTLTYIPCRKIKELSTLVNEEDSTMILKIHLHNGEIVDSIFDPSNRTQMDALVNYF